MASRKRTDVTWLESLVRDYDHVHTMSGILGNTLFVVGSAFFFKRFEQWQTFAVWLFVIGSACMLVGALGDAFKSAYEKRADRLCQA